MIELTQQAEMFLNRVAKNYRHLRKWARRAGIECFRIYDRDIPEGGAIRGDAPMLVGAGGVAATAEPPSWLQATTLQEFKSGSERAYLVARLRENGWNISKTAEVIDTPRSNLYKKLEQYQISQEKDGS